MEVLQVREHRQPLVAAGHSVLSELEVLEGRLAGLVAGGGPAGLRTDAEAVGFAARVEQVSRLVGQLQVMAAADLDARRAAGGAASSAAGPLVPGSLEDAATGGTAGVSVFEGFRNTAELLRSVLRISAAEARRRLALADTVLPSTGLGGQDVPARYPALGEAFRDGTLSSRAATLITLALERTRHLCTPDTLDGMERALVRTAGENDEDFLVRMAQRWVTAIDQDGPEPSEEELRHRQGLFIRRRHRGLHHLEIFATDDQYEHLATVIHTATNPRAATGSAGGATGEGGEGVSGVFERRSRAQQLLDGLITACEAALATGGLPATGGLRPQVMVTINYQDLLRDLTNRDLASRHESDRTGGRGAGTAGGGGGRFVFTGPVNPSSIRRIACDAEILPVVLGGDGQVLDVGRSARAFPPHQRKALVARDGGCTAPGCTVPAPWCEAHHVTWWSRGGPTGISNAALACAYHHHLVHKERWRITLRNGIPWWTPPPELDPTQTPKRNTYFDV